MPVSTTVNHYTAVKLMNIGYGFRFQWVFVTIVVFLVSLYWLEIAHRPKIRVSEGVIGTVVIGLAKWFVIRQKFASLAGGF